MDKGMSGAAVKNDFSKGSVAGNILRMAIPITAAQLVNVVYNLVDRMYIGRLEGSGTLALTGLGICLPVIAIINAFTRLAGQGGASLCSIERGRGDYETAERIMGNSFFLVLLFGAVLMAVGIGFRRPILYAFGASDATYGYAADYLTIYLLGTFFVMITSGMNGFINSQGFAKTGMLTVAIGAALNIVLDPLFIFALGLGVRGAAIATVLSQLVSAVWVMRFLTGRRAVLRLKCKNLRPSAPLMKRILSLGVAGFVMACTNSVVQIAANRMLRLYGSDLYITAMTVLASVREVTMMLVSGITSGSEPVLGYNYGAQQYARVRGGIRFTLTFSLCYSVVVWALLMLFPSVFIRVFNDDPALLTLGRHAMRCYYPLYFMMAFQFGAQSTFVALGKSKQAIFFSLLRKVIIVVPLTLLLPRIAAIGVDGVFFAEPISDLIGGTAAFSTMLATVWFPLKRKEKQHE